MSAVAPVVTPHRRELVTRVAKLRAGGMTHAEVARKLGITRSYAASLATDPDRTKELARRESYKGTCEECGAPTDGSNGRAKAPTHCSPCQHATEQARARWNHDSVIAAIRRWNDEHGRPPTAMEWMRASRPSWAPSTGAVARYNGWKNAPFATWSDALEAAGFERRVIGKRPGETWWSPELVIERLRETADGQFAPRYEPRLGDAAKRYFGSWSNAVDAAGLARRKHWSWHVGRAARTQVKV